MRGCEYRCIYCDQRRTASPEDIPAPADITGILNNEIKAPGPWTVAFFGGTFTGMERKLQNAYCDAVWVSSNAELISEIRVSTRPDALDEHDVVFLEENGVRTIELGVQSFDDIVLAASGRGYSCDVAAKAAHLTKEAGINLGIQLMPGLPGEDEKNWEKTVEATIAILPDFVRLYPSLVVDGTPLADMYRSGSYRSLSIEEASVRCVYAIEHFGNADIRVERVGLQETAGLSNEVIAGPYHPAFGEIVYSYLMRKRIEEVIGGRYLDLTVHVTPNMVSAAVGHKRMNLDYFSESYGISVKIVPDEDLTGFEIRVR